MKFVLFRHAQKGITPFEDPELNPRGFEQASQLLQMLKLNKLPIPSRIEVSPKRRAAQTLLPVARQAQLQLITNPLLDQRKDDESALEFRKRIQFYLNSIETLDSENSANESVIYACTHYDWLEEAMTLITCNRDLTGFEYSHWAPTQFLIFEINDQTWNLTSKGAAE